MDTLLQSAIADDYMVFDGTFTGVVEHLAVDTLADLNNGTIANAIVTITIEGCLFRNIATRSDSSKKQLNQREVAIAVDEFVASDRVVEVPLKYIASVREGDTFIDDTTRKWKVIAVDTCTLQTRLRLGLKAFE